jgi:hypothetical protein
MSTITITLKPEELIYDVQNKTYITHRSRKKEGQNDDEAAYIAANDDEGNKDQILRSIGNAFAVLKSKLSEYLNDTGTTADDTQLTDKANLTLALNMPSNYNQSSRDAIAAAAHQYLVNVAVSEWFNMTDKQDAAEYVAMSQANLAALREAINKRQRPKKPTT